MGGDWGSYSYQEYNPGIIIVAGKVIYNDVSGGTFSCIDLRTGELLYRASGSIDQAHAVKLFYQTAGQTEGNEGNPEVRLWAG